MTSLEGSTAGYKQAVGDGGWDGGLPSAPLVQPRAFPA